MHGAQVQYVVQVSLDGLGAKHLEYGVREVSLFTAFIEGIERDKLLRIFDR